MGSASSLIYGYHLETPEEIKERSRIIALQNQALDYVTKVMFYGVSVRTGRKPSSKIDQIWIEPQPDLLEEAMRNHDETNIDLINCAPSGVLIDTKSNIKILFTMNEVEYTLRAQDVVDYLAAKRNITTVNSNLEAPKAPQLDKATPTSLALSWAQLPFPVGIIQKIEVQYVHIEDIDDQPSTSSLRWSSLTNKFYNSKGFTDHTMYQLQPGNHFRFRLRYYCDAGWSLYSSASPIYSTLPDRPSKPAAPMCIAITATAVELQWQEHTRDNGSPITLYILQGRSVGDVFMELYSGMGFSHLELGIFPDYAYNFQLIVVNAMGESDPSSIVSVRSPQRQRQRIPGMPEVKLHKGFDDKQITMSVQCKDAWKECWDPKTEQIFYFNKILGTRQLHKPQVMIDEERAAALEQEKTAEKKKQDALKAKETEFRKKRYRLLRALHKNKNTVIAAANRQSRGSFDGSLPAVSSLVYDSFVLNVEGNALSAEGSGTSTAAVTPVSTASSNNNKPITIELRRECMLPDCVKAFSTMSLLDFYKRLKITFSGEAGIDSGGLSKEAFLLLSKHSAQFVGPQVRKWMKALKSVETTDSGSVLEVEGLFFESNNTITTIDDVRAQAAANSSSLASNVNSNSVIKDKVTSTNVLTKKAIDLLDFEICITSEKFFQFLGKLIGKALFDRQLIEFPLSSLLLQHMLGGLPFENKVNSTGNIVNRKSESSLQSEVNQMLVDIKDIDEALHKSLHWIANNNITNIIYENFSVTDGNVELPLCASGDTKEVTEENKFEYIQLMILWKTKYSISNSLFPFLTSFHEFIPLTILKDCGVTKQELNLILNGKSTVDVEELRAYCIYEADDLEEFNENSDVIIWFWRLFRELNDSERRLLLKFFTGSSRVPLDGYDPPLNITQGCDYMKDDSLPTAHTCFNQIVLPNYTSYEVCKEKILFAMRNSEGFDLA